MCRILLPVSGTALERPLNILVTLIVLYTNMCPDTTALLDADKALERQLSCRCVLIISVEEEGKQKAIVCVPNLVYQLYERDHDMYMNALLAIRSIAASPSSRAMILKVLEDDPDMLATITKDLQLHLAAFRYESGVPKHV